MLVTTNLKIDMHKIKTYLCNVSKCAGCSLPQRQNIVYINEVNYVGYVVITDGVKADILKLKTTAKIPALGNKRRYNLYLE